MLTFRKKKKCTNGELKTWQNLLELYLKLPVTVVMAFKNSRKNFNSYFNISYNYNQTFRTDVEEKNP